MTWFENLTGVSEESAEQVRSVLSVHGIELRSGENGRSYTCGTLDTPSLGELRRRVSEVRAGRKPTLAGRMRVREVVADVQSLHADPANAGALFQVASQFNLLEMVTPARIPEEGVGIYEYDRTQGPACAVACGAGTIYRNYFAPVNGRIGQSADNQIDCLADLGVALGNEDDRLWTMKNGYVLPTRAGLAEVASRLETVGEEKRDELRSLLRIGLQRNTQVTLDVCDHLVSQAYCSALPVSYSGIPSEEWEPFARLVLEAAYEATLCAGVINAVQTGNNKVFLTLLGGGAFGNESAWIVDAASRGLDLFRESGLDVVFVIYGSANRNVRELTMENKV